MSADVEALVAEACAEPLTGWDFSFLHGRVVAEPLPWDFEELARTLVGRCRRLLDVDTGGGEVLAALAPPAASIALEPYPPNVAVARTRLEPLGVEVRERLSPRMPVSDGSVDLVLNRHGAVDLDEVVRVLRPGGTFLTQQVGARNDHELRVALGSTDPGPDGWTDAATVESDAVTAGLVVDRVREAWPRTTYLDVGAVVYQARRVPWEVPGFDPVAARDRLVRLGEQLRRTGGLVVTSHRLLLQAHRS